MSDTNGLTVEQEVAMEATQEVTRCLTSYDTERLKLERLSSPVIKATRCLFAEALLGKEVYSFNDLSTQELLFVESSVADIGRFMYQRGITPLSEAGVASIIGWQARYSKHSNSGWNTLLKMRVVLEQGKSWSERALRKGEHNANRSTTL